jgi:hypothetical protein
MIDVEFFARAAWWRLLCVCVGATCLVAGLARVALVRDAKVRAS